MQQNPDRFGAASGTTGALASIVELVGALDHSGVAYCHWKSNEAIDRSASGENDLDLLVAREDAIRFETVLHQLGFRLARPTPDRQVPGVLDYYNLDEGSGRLVHVHAHYRLVVGDDMTKNFRLPIERAYLKSGERRGLFPVPSAEFEYVVFVLRMVVKHCPWDAQLSRRGRLSPSERREFVDLEERIDRGEVDRILTEHVAFIDRVLFEDCRVAVARDAGPLARAVTGRRVLRALDGHGRRSPFADLLLRLWRRSQRRIARKITKQRPRKRLDTGGLLIGVVGGDGAGKSSAVAMIVASLSRDLVTTSVHLGKPDRAPTTRVVKKWLRVSRGLGRFQATGLPAGVDFERLGFPGYGFLLSHVLNARDRYRAYLGARRAANAGTVVVCDRFPLKSLRLMDGARTAEIVELEGRPLARWLIDREAAYYDRILPPDLLIVLRVEPEIAVERRRGDEDEDFVRRRAAEVWEQNWVIAHADSVVVVDAARPHPDVLADIRATVWAAL
jgi:thymidylate kinase